MNTYLSFSVPVCPHAGGVALCELVQHLSMFDFVGVSGTMENRFVNLLVHILIITCNVRNLKLFSLAN